MDYLIDWMPSVYRNFLPSFLSENRSINEYLASCKSCNMIKKRSDAFLPQTKCCTYFPEIPNYMVGAILYNKDIDSREGKKRISAIISEKKGVTPLGISPPKKYSVLFSSSKDCLGKNKALVCPFLIKRSKLCAIWKKADSNCLTYFCKYVYGPKGKEFWSAINRYLKHVERALSLFVMFIEKFDAISYKYIENYLNIKYLEREDLDGMPPKPEVYKRLWSNYFSKEKYFYAKSFEIIRKLSKSDFERITGITQKILLEEVKYRYNDMKYPIIPKMLILNPKIDIKKIDSNLYQLQTKFGQFEFSKKLIEILKCFNGLYDNKEVFNKVKKKFQTKIEEDLFLFLINNQILIG